MNTIFTCNVFTAVNQNEYIAVTPKYSVFDCIIGDPNSAYEYEFAGVTYQTTNFQTPYPNVVDVRRMIPNSIYVVSNLNNTNIQIAPFPYNPLKVQTYPFIAPTFITFGGRRLYFLSTSGMVTYYDITTNTTSSVNLPIQDLDSTDALDIGSLVYWKSGTTLNTVDLTTNQLLSTNTIPQSTWLDIFSSMPYVIGNASGCIYLFDILDKIEYRSTTPVWNSFYCADIISVNNTIVIISTGELITNYFGNTLPNIYLAGVNQ